MKVGITGTREGLSEEQRIVLVQKLRTLAPLEVHHGMCEGVDSEFHEIIRNLYPECKIVGHPPVKTVKMLDLGLIGKRILRRSKNFNRQTIGAEET